MRWEEKHETVVVHQVKKGCHSRENNQLVRGWVKWVPIRFGWWPWQEEQWWGKRLVKLGSNDNGRGGIGDNQYKQLSEEFCWKKEAKKWGSNWSGFGIKRPVSQGTFKGSSGFRVWAGWSLCLSTKRAQLKVRDYRVTGSGSQENLSVVSGGKEKETI